MNFFEAQDQARGRTRLLIFYYLCAVVTITVLVYLAAVLLFGAGEAYAQSGAARARGAQPGPQFNWWSPQILLWTCLGVLGLIGGASLFKVSQLRGGGGVVARSLGGRLVDPHTAKGDERVLLNVVEEMAIASGSPVPEVYLLDNEQGVNAFAAGFSPDDAAIGVTRGALDAFSRDELQGVIAHEFAHVLNGDMRMNIRLMGVLFGILVLAVAGQGLMRVMFFSGGSRGRGRGGGPAIAIFIFGVALMIIGYIGVLFGRLIQAAVSRQREYLADASAVQFTRNPDGIANALRRIGGTAGSRVENPESQETAHLFFANALKKGFGGGLATHPPLPARIAAIKPDWDGEWLAGQARLAVSERGGQAAGAPPPPSGKPPRRFAAQPQDFITAVGTIGAAQLAYAGQMRHQIPDTLEQAIHEPLNARAVVFALLLDRKPELRERQLKTLEEDAGEALAHAIRAHASAVDALGAQARLPLLELCVPALQRLDAAHRKAFLRRVRRIALSDQEVTSFELLLMRLLDKRLKQRPGGRADSGGLISSKDKLREPLSHVLSYLTWIGAAEAAAARESFAQAIAPAQTIRSWARFLEAGELDIDKLEAGLDVLGHTPYRVRKEVLETCARLVVSDGQVDREEAETLRAIAIAINCPMPPLGLGEADPGGA